MSVLSSSPKNGIVPDVWPAPKLESIVRMSERTLKLANTKARSASFYVESLDLFAEMEMMLSMYKTQGLRLFLFFSLSFALLPRASKMVSGHSYGCALLFQKDNAITDDWSWEIFDLWARSWIRSTTVAISKNEILPAMCWNHLQDQKWALESLPALRINTRPWYLSSSFYHFQYFPPPNFQNALSYSTWLCASLPYPKQMQSRFMASIRNITMRAECMRWATGSKSPKRMIKLGMCEPKVKIELAMSTEQWLACCVYKLCQVAYFSITPILTSFRYLPKLPVRWFMTVSVS